MHYGYYYLAGPYAGTDAQKQDRFERYCKVSSHCIRNGVHMFSPVVHNHAMMETAKDWSLEDRQNLILPFDFSLLHQSKGIVVLKLGGWETSYGVAKELQFCKKYAIPVHKYTYDEIMDNPHIIEGLQR